MSTDFASLPRVNLAEWPTPLQKAKQLSELLGIRLLVKRDDLSGLGAGGNKARKLEFHLGQAIAEKSTHIITTGAAQSNHAHLTAAAARKLGLQAHLVLNGRSDLPRRVICCMIKYCKRKLLLLSLLSVKGIKSI
jgi:L-cysteate sulfo-lyase